MPCHAVPCRAMPGLPQDGRERAPWYLFLFIFHRDCIKNLRIPPLFPPSPVPRPLPPRPLAPLRLSYPRYILGKQREKNGGEDRSWPDAGVTRGCVWLLDNYRSSRFGQLTGRRLHDRLRCMRPKQLDGGPVTVAVEGVCGCGCGCGCVNGEGMRASRIGQYYP